VNNFWKYFLTLLTQFAGGPGPAENNLMRFGLAAILWGALLVAAWSRQRRHELPREKLLVWGFGLGFAREMFMFSHVSLRMLGVLENEILRFSTEPLEHALTLAAVVVVAGSFLRYILGDALLPRRYLQIGLGASAVCFLVTFWWWPGFLSANPGVRFHQSWGAWLFHLTASILLVTAIVVLTRRRGWLSNVVAVALMFFFLGESIMLANFATNKTYAHTLCPISNSFHIAAIPLLGYVYLREQSIAKKHAEEALEAHRVHLEELVEERTAELTTTNEQLQQEIMERAQAERALARLSRRNKLILESAGEGIVAIDQQGNHTLVNPAAERMLGYQVEELIGRPSHTTWHHSKPDGAPYPEEECPIHAGYKEGVVRRGDDQVFWRKDGSSFPVRYMSTSVRENGQLAGAVVVFQDITERKQAEAEIARRSAELAAQNAVAATISQSLDLDTVLNAALGRVLSVLKMEVGGIFLSKLNGQTMKLRAYRGQASSDDFAESVLRCCACGEISDRAVAAMTAVAMDVSEQHAGNKSPLVIKENIQTLVSAPLVSKGRAVGALTLGVQRPDAISAHELQLLTSIGQQIGMAVENVRLYQETEDWAHGLALLHQATVFLTSTLDPATITEQITEQAAKLLGCQVAVLCEWDEENQQVETVSSFSADGPELEDLSGPPDGLILRDLIGQDRSIAIEDAQADPRVPPKWREKLSIKALLCLPIGGKQKPARFLCVIEQHRPRRWRAEEVALAESFVHSAAIALENAHLHRQAERAAMLEERQRIAAEMHDGLAQILSYLGHRVDRATELAEAGDIQEVVSQHRQIRNAIDRGSGEVRRSIASLQERPRPRQSLQEGLTEVVDEFTKEGGAPVELVFHHQAPLHLSPHHLEQVLRVVREALSNAGRHAQAQQIIVCLEKQGDQIVVVVKDDGQGFDPDTPPADSSYHFGLSIMRARAARIGGRVTIDSAPGQGTRVTLAWSPDDNTAHAERDVQHTPTLDNKLPV
jgi:PAS domain S-box-containing protein